jgi:hypothetical protein
MFPNTVDIIRVGTSHARILSVTAVRIEYLDMTEKRQSINLEECAKNWVRWHHDHTQEFVLIGSKTDADAWNARCVGTRSALTHPPSAELMNERNTRFEFTNSEALYRELLGPLLHKGWHTFDTD